MERKQNTENLETKIPEQILNQNPDEYKEVLEKQTALTNYCKNMIELMGPKVTARYFSR